MKCQKRSENIVQDLSDEKNPVLGHLRYDMQTILATDTESLSQLAVMTDEIGETIIITTLLVMATNYDNCNKTGSRIERQITDLSHGA